MSLSSAAGSMASCSALVDLTIDPKGTVLAALPIRFDDSQLRLWSLSKKQRLSDPPCLWNATPIYDPSFLKRSVAFSLDGSVLVCPSAEGKVIVWDVAGKKVLVSLQTRLAIPCDLAFSDNGTILASGDSVGIVQLWGVRP